MNFLNNIFKNTSNHFTSRGFSTLNFNILSKPLKFFRNRTDLLVASNSTFSSPHILKLVFLGLFLQFSRRKSNNFHCLFGFGGSSSQLEKNSIKNRIHSIHYPANNPIEDRTLVKNLTSVNGFLVGVFDGHGGWQVSEYVSEHYAQELDLVLEEQKKNFDIINDKDTWIIKSIELTHDRIELKLKETFLMMYKMGFPKVARVGSCSLTAVVVDNQVYVANAGDSQGLLLSENESKNGFLWTRLNQKLNANSKKEQSRLAAQYPGEKDIVVCKRGKQSCYVKGKLQPTRAFGDFRLKHEQFNNPENHDKSLEYDFPIINFTGNYIEHQPEMRVFEIKEKDKFLVIGCDGLWDELQKQNVADIIYNNRTESQQIMTSLLKESLQVAAQQHRISYKQICDLNPGTRRSYHDDISIILVNLENQMKN